MKLLIVDDNAGIRALIRELLEHRFGELRECSSSEEALDACRTFRPDFITLDLRMQGMHGLACAQALRTMLPGVRIAVVSQFDHATIRAKAHSVGVDVFVVKDRLEKLTDFVESIWVMERQPGMAAS